MGGVSECTCEEIGTTSILRLIHRDRDLETLVENDLRFETP